MFIQKCQAILNKEMYFLALSNARCFSALHTDVLVFNLSRELF